MNSAGLLSIAILSLVGASRPDKHIVELPLSPKHAAFQKLAGQLDILGADFSKGVLHARVSASQRFALQKMGIDVVDSHSSFVQKTNVGLDGYTKPNAVATKLRQLATAYPHLAKTFEFGRSVDNATLIGIEISSASSTQQKPVVFFNALHHARELMTTEIALHLAETLLKGYEKDEAITRWLNNYTIVVVPQVNPDGHALVHRGYPWWRKNTAGQTVMYGVDLNRNYPTLWNACKGSSGVQSDDTYRGPRAASEPETQAMLKLFEKYRPVANISYHTYAEAILYPFGCQQTENPSQQLFHAIGSEMRAAIVNDEGIANTYKLGSAPDILYNADGGDNDSHWQQFGTISFAIEAGSTKQGFQPDFETWRNLTVTRQEGGWRALLDRMGRGAIRATVASGVPLNAVRYTLKTAPANGSPLKQFSPEPVLPFELRSNDGLFYQLVEPDQVVEIQFFNGDKLLKTITTESTNGVVDLGTIQLN